MSIRSNGSYIGFSRTTTLSQGSASGIWDLRTAERRRRASAWPGDPVDEFFSSVAILLHMDGSGSTFVDSSGTPKTITAGGNATQSTAESKFGGKSLYVDGNGDSISFADVALGTDAFAIEMWFKSNSSTQYAQLIGNEVNGGADGFTLLINNNSSSGGQITLYRQGSLVLSSSSGDWSDDAWHHLALVRSGSTITLYIDGTSYGSATDASSYSGGAYYVGRNNVFSGRDLVAYIDELRITKGSARGYTGASITVPTAAFPDQ
jgi:hypothetical protein